MLTNACLHFLLIFFSTTFFSVQTTNVPRRSAGTQTPLASPLYLPDGVTLDRLVQLLHSAPEVSVTELTLQLSRGRPCAIPQEQMVIVELILRGMDMAERRLIRLTAQQQEVVRRVGIHTAEAEALSGAFGQYIERLADRPQHYEQAAYVEPIDLDTVPADVEVISAYGQLIHGTLSEGFNRRPSVLSPDCDRVSDYYNGTFIDVSDDSNGYN